MLIPTHLATGYFLSRLLGWYLQVDNTWYFIIGTLLGALPDLDSLYYLFFKRKKLKLDPSFHKHRQTFLHAPIFHLVVSVVIILINFNYGLLYFVCVFSHLLLDTFFIGEGIPWLWPFSKNLYGAFQALKPFYNKVFKRGKEIGLIEYFVHNPGIILVESLQVAVIVLLSIYLFH